MVLNGLEMASGSIRINRAELQTRVLDVIGIAPDEAEERFGFLLRALRFGAPPHGGIAPGIDRIAMQLGDTDNLREVVAFPKLGGGADPLTGAPAPLPPEQLAELGLAVVRKPSSVSKLRACASTPITRPRRPSPTRPGRPCSRSCASTSATPRSRIGPGARPGAASTRRVRRPPRRSASTPPTSSSPAAPPRPTTSRSSAARRAGPGASSRRRSSTPP